MFPPSIKHQFPDHTEEKKEEGLRGRWVYVSLGFLLVGFRRTQYISEFGGFYNNEGFYLEDLEGVWLWRISDPYLKWNWLLEIFWGKLWEGINDTPGGNFPPSFYFRKSISKNIFIIIPG